MTQTPSPKFSQQIGLIRLLQGLALLDSGHDLLEVRRQVDAITADHWLQRMTAVPISPQSEGWPQWMAARRSSLRTACRSLHTPRIPAPEDPAYRPDETTRSAPVTTTRPAYMAAVHTAADELSGPFCDVVVATSDVVSTREAEDGSEAPVYGMADIVLGPLPTTVRADDDDKITKAQKEAAEILDRAGWQVDGDWAISYNAMYAGVIPVHIP